MKTLTKNEREKLDRRYRAKLINSLSGFKSVNLIATKSEKSSNLSIISSAFHLGADPALMGFIIRPDSVVRGTLKNLRKNGICTLNHAHSNIVEQAHQTSARYPENVSEFEQVKLNEEYLDGFEIPFVKESKIKFSLKMLREIVIQENGTHMIICEIQNIYYPKDVLLEDGSIDIHKAETLTVSGLDTYFETTKIGKLSYAKPDKDLEWL